MFQRTKEWVNKVNLSSFELENFFKFVLAWLAREKPNNLTPQPCLHTLMQTLLSANQSAHTILVILWIWIFLLALLDLFAAFSVRLLRFSSLAVLKRENLSAVERRSQRFRCNDWLERQVLDLINTLISMDDNSTRYILLPNAIICKLEVLHDPVPSFVSRSLPYCQVVGL